KNITLFIYPYFYAHRATVFKFGARVGAGYDFAAGDAACEAKTVGVSTWAAHEALPAAIASAAGAGGVLVCAIASCTLSTIISIFSLRLSRCSVAGIGAGAGVIISWTGIARYYSFVLSSIIIGIAI